MDQTTGREADPSRGNRLCFGDVCTSAALGRDRFEAHDSLDSLAARTLPPRLFPEDCLASESSGLEGTRVDTRPNRLTVVSYFFGF